MKLKFGMKKSEICQKSEKSHACNISVVVTLMKVSRVGDLPTGGVHPVGFENWSYIVEFDSPKRNFLIM